MAFSDDLSTDRDNVFLNILEFAETVTYRVASTGATSSIPAEVEDSGDSVLTDGIEARISAGDVAAPVKGDQITKDSKVYTITFVGQEAEQGVFLLTAEREELIT